MEKLGDDKFVQHCVVNPAGAKKEAWVILTLKVLSLVPGVDMETGAPGGCYGPTNKENTVGGTQSNFLTKEKIVWPPFVKKG